MFLRKKCRARFYHYDSQHVCGNFIPEQVSACDFWLFCILFSNFIQARLSSLDYLYRFNFELINLRFQLAIAKRLEDTMLVGMVLPQRSFKKGRENHDDHGTSEIMLWTCHRETCFSCWRRHWICFYYFATVRCIFQLLGTLDNTIRQLGQFICSAT